MISKEKREEFYKLYGETIQGDLTNIDTDPILDWIEQNFVEKEKYRKKSKSLKRNT